ncbi:MAG: hypothetical protein ACRC62_18585 [Microcoleus sp.]
MSSGNILTVTDVLNLLVSGIDKTTLETELTASGWISTPARGGAPGEQPLNSSGKPGSRADTHFILLP